MYRGNFNPINPNKYDGDHQTIVYRSSWELSVMLWCDSNPKVVSWSSEELILPYLCPTDGSYHRYFVDFQIKLASGKNLWIEVKPKKYTQPPKRPKRQTRRYIAEILSYAKNQAKWKAADELAKKNNAQFSVWTEDTLKALGIKLLTK